MKNELIVARHELSALQRAIQNAQMQLNELLDFSKISDGEPPVIPKVYLSHLEAARCLSISAPTLKSMEHMGLLDVDSDRINKRDRYLLEDILWLLDKPFRGARKKSLDQLIKEKNMQKQSREI